MAPVFLSRLTAIVLIVAERPSNPHFNHYLFEALSAIVRYASSATGVWQAVARRALKRRWPRASCRACRFGADPSPQTVAVFEQALFPAFEKILQADITGACATERAPEARTVTDPYTTAVSTTALAGGPAEFMPYVFQILAQLLELQTGEVSAAYLALLKPIMAPVLWEQSGASGLFLNASARHTRARSRAYPRCPTWRTNAAGNVPSLSRLLQAYIAKASAAILQQNLLSAVLGIFQRQVSRSSTDHEGFAILASLLKHITPYVPLPECPPPPCSARDSSPGAPCGSRRAARLPRASLQPFCRDIFILLLQRLNAKETRTPKYVRAFAKFLFTFVARTPNGAVVLYETLNGIQPGYPRRAASGSPRRAQEKRPGLTHQSRGVPCLGEPGRAGCSRTCSSRSWCRSWPSP